MKTLYSTLALSLFLSSCSSWTPDQTLAQMVHEDVIQELKDRKGTRAPASVKDLVGANFRDLNRLSPGKFEIYVFPKVSNMTTRTDEVAEVYLGKPQAFEVSVIALSPCKEFIQNNLFAKYTPKAVFPESLSEGGRQCAIIEFTSKSLREMGKGNLKKDDLLQMRIFLDDSYKVYASDYEYYETPGKNLIARVKTEGGETFSGLNLYPVELPEEFARSEKTSLLGLIGSRVDDVAVFQVQRRLNRNFSVPDCRGVIFEQKNTLGENSRIGWCEKMPWPAYSENGRFVSIIQPVSLK